MRAAASTCTTHWDGLWGIPGSNEESQQWGGCEAGMGQRGVFRGGCEWVSSWPGQSERKGQTGNSSALSSCERILVLWVFQGLDITSLDSSRGVVFTGGMWCVRVQGNCMSQGLSLKSRRGQQEQEGTAGGRQPKSLLLGSLLLSQVSLPRMRSEQNWECSANP